jgi:hypothetical protein
MTEIEPQLKPVDILKVSPRVNLILIDEIKDRELDREPEYNPWNDPEDLTTYLEPYQND